MMVVRRARMLPKFGPRLLMASLPRFFPVQRPPSPPPLPIPPHQVSAAASPTIGAAAAEGRPAAVRQPGPTRASESLVRSYAEYDDAVYAAAWSAASPGPRRR